MMKISNKHYLLILIFTALGLVLAACQGEERSNPPSIGSRRPVSSASGCETTTRR